ncbi:hypothetical protein [Pseudomonas aeruginosa]
MKTRIFLRTLRFVAYNWWLPFLLGNVSALVGFAFRASCSWCLQFSATVSLMSRLHKISDTLQGKPP